MPKKLLIVGSLSAYAIERHFLKYLASYYDLRIFDSKGIFLKYYHKSIWNKILVRLNIGNFYKKINENLIGFFVDFEPDIILVFKGMEIKPSTLKYATSKRIFLVNYNPDNPFIFSGRGSGNSNVKKSISLYDLHITYDAWIKENIEKKYHIPVRLLPFGFEINNLLSQNVTNEKEIKKTCFVGMPDKYRAEFLNKLAESGIEIDVYGLHWSKFLTHKNITVFNPVFDEDLYKTLYKYRVQLNYMRPHNMNSHNMRTFEIPAIGGIQLAPATVDHIKFFNVGKEIFTYSDIYDCTKKIKYLLSLSETDAQLIRKNAKEKSISAKYSYKERAEELFHILKENFDHHH